MMLAKYSKRILEYVKVLNPCESNNDQKIIEEIDFFYSGDEEDIRGRFSMTKALKWQCDLNVK